jgi:hypothetical protein
MKAMHRLMLTSQAYQMASINIPANVAIDPENRMFWRAPRERLEAEIIRDEILAVSGALDRTLGGPSIFPYIDPDLFEYDPFGGDPLLSAHDDHPEPSPAEQRRIIEAACADAAADERWARWQAEPDQSGRRNRTTIAPQALWMNNGMVLTQAKIFADRAEAGGGADVASRSIARSGSRCAGADSINASVDPVRPEQPRRLGGVLSRALQFERVRVRP